MPKGDKPTPKEKLFAKKYIENNFNGTQAVLDVYNTKKRSNAKSISYQNLQKPVVQEEINKLLDKAGLSLNELNAYTKNSIEMNMKYGKPSQAVAATLIQHAYKLHNALPKNTKVSIKHTVIESLTRKDYKEVTEDLKKISLESSKLVEDLS